MIFNSNGCNACCSKCTNKMTHLCFKSCFYNKDSKCENCKFSKIDTDNLIYAEDEYGGFLCTPEYYESVKDKYNSIICYAGSLEEISKYMCHDFNYDNILYK